MEALEERTNTLILGVLAVAVAVIGIVVALIQLRVLSQKTRRLDVYELP
jgi:mannose/fructose/N-acetylgalactosamine-specific phosphotransferase system component IIC